MGAVPLRGPAADVAARLPGLAYAWDDELGDELGYPDGRHVVWCDCGERCDTTDTATARYFAARHANIHARSAIADPES